MVVRDYLAGDFRRRGAGGGHEGGKGRDGGKGRRGWKEKLSCPSCPSCPSCLSRPSDRHWRSNARQSVPRTVRRGAVYGCAGVAWFHFSARSAQRAARRG